MNKKKKKPVSLAKRGHTARTATSELEEAVGGRVNLLDILSNTARDTKQDILMRLLSDPARSKDSLVTLCASAGVSNTEVLSLFREAAVARSFTKAQVTLSERLDAVVADVADKAQNHTEPCGCLQVQPAGTVADPGCPNCSGTGLRHFRGSFDHAQLVFRAAGMTKEGGGVKVNVNQQVGVALGGGFLDKFVKATDDAAFDVVEAQEVEPPTGGEDPGAAGS